ncbi:hypothetical protein GQ600_20230 [Phytophthora cactorum]|nr:hypothetical protein GQ600_20230 [Phytophthora cactorum]
MLDQIFSDGSFDIRPENGEKLEVAAPRLKRSEFESWEDLDMYLAEYVPGSKQLLMPAEWENYGKTFICTHSGKYKPRGKGKRKRLQSRAMECGTQACYLVGLSWASLTTVGHTSLQLGKLGVSIFRLG